MKEKNGPQQKRGRNRDSSNSIVSVSLSNVAVIKRPVRVNIRLKIRPGSTQMTRALIQTGLPTGSVIVTAAMDGKQLHRVS